MVLDAMDLSGQIHRLCEDHYKSGRLSPSVPLAEATVTQIGEWMSGLWDEVAVHA